MAVRREEARACGRLRCQLPAPLLLAACQRSLLPLRCTHRPLGSPLPCPAAAALHGGTNILEWHRGSPLRLLALLNVYNGGLWLFTFSIVADLPLALNAVALPCLAAIPVSALHAAV